MADIKRETVDKAVELIKKSNPNVSTDQARKIVREQAEPLNNQKRDRR